MTRPSIVSFARRLMLTAATACGVALAVACSQPAPAPPPAAPPAAKTPQERVQMYKDCWNLFNTKDWDKFAQCYAENAVSENIDSTPPSVTGRAAILERDKKLAEAFPDRKGAVQLMLVNGGHAASIAIYTGTNTGPMPPGPDGKVMPATNKKIGFYIAHTIDYDQAGAYAARDAGYIEEGTMMAQLGVSKNPARKAITATGAPATVVIGANDEKERNNLVVIQNLMAAGNKHDLKGIEALLSDDYKLIEIGQPADMNKKQAMASNKEFIAAFPDLSMTPAATWTAGDYVVIEGSIAGTNKGPAPSMGLAKATNKPFQGRFFEVLKIENGKVKDDWLFYNGAAFATQMGMK